jgi:NTE family protein
MAPGSDTLIQTAADRGNLQALFGALPLLKDLPGPFLGEITQEIEWFSLPGGATLFRAGEAVDGFYVIINGGLGVYVPNAGGGSRLVGQVAGGQIVGEADVLSGRTRAATVVALRDTEVARLPTSLFERLVVAYPRAMREIAQGLAQRLESAPGPYQQSKAKSKTFAIVPHGPEVDGEAFARSFVNCLRRMGRADWVAHTTGGEKTSHWFHRLERAHDFVVYVTDYRASNWTKLCLRQADVVLLLASDDSDWGPWEALVANGRDAIKPQSLELVLLHNRTKPTSTTRQWLDIHGNCRLHHVRLDSDIARVTRILTGRAVGLVLSGGGARGFAHLGVMRALHEAKFPIDCIGATSIGSIIAGGWAAGWDYQEMVQRIRRTFVDSSPTSDYTWPLMSLLSGRKVGRRLRQEFGEIDIEDLPLPFFCVSTNLTRGQIAVHQRGPLWMWLRASVAIPGMLPPVIVDRQVYVDGATINNLPVDVMRELFEGKVIAADAGADRAFETDVELIDMPRVWQLRQWRKLRQSKINIMQILLRAGMINSAATTISQRELADVLLKLPTGGINLLDWKSFDRVIELGYQYASAALQAHTLQV